MFVHGSDGKNGNDPVNRDDFVNCTDLDSVAPHLRLCITLTDMGFMNGMRGLVVGVANENSIATSIAESLLREGAECLFTHIPGEKNERRTRKAVESLGVKEPWMMPLDASSDEQLDATFAKIGADFGSIDFLVHCIAYADKDWLRPDKFAGTPRSVFTNALDISAYTYIPTVVANKHRLTKSYIDFSTNISPFKTMNPPLTIKPAESSFSDRLRSDHDGLLFKNRLEGSTLKFFK